MQFNMFKREDDLPIEDIIDSGKKIFRSTNGMDFDQFMNDMKTINVVIRNFEIIREAANSCRWLLSSRFKRMLLYTMRLIVVFLFFYPLVPLLKAACLNWSVPFFAIGILFFNIDFMQGLFIEIYKCNHNHEV